MSSTDLFSAVGWPKSVIIVADASALLQDLRFGAQGSLGILLELAGLGFVAAPRSVMLETEQHLPRMVASDASETELRALWDEYKELILVVDINPDEATGAAVEALRYRDPQDVALVAVAQALPGRAVIGTGDLDLISLDLAPANWLDLARSVKEIAMIDSTELATFLLVRLVALGSAGLIRAASSGVIPARVALVGLAALIAHVMADRDRRTRARAGAERILRAYGDLLASRESHAKRLHTRTATVG